MTAEEKLVKRYAVQDLIVNPEMVELINGYWTPYHELESQIVANKRQQTIVDRQAETIKRQDKQLTRRDAIIKALVQPAETALATWKERRDHIGIWPLSDLERDCLETQILNTTTALALAAELKGESKS